MAAKSEEIGGPKFERATQAQIKFYVEYCKKHPEISQYLSKRRGKIAPIHIQELWSQLADTLNSMNGPTRTAKKWQESLAMWKNKLRARARQNSAQTGKRCRQEDLLKLIESKYSKYDAVPTMKKRQPEKPANVHHQTEDSEATCDLELPFDSIFLPCDGMMGSTSSSSRSPSPVSDVSPAPASKTSKKQTKKSVNSQRGNFSGICNTLIKSLEARREREEILSINQQNVIMKLDQTLTAMNQVLEKIDFKLYSVLSE
ncbi:uncharacterized protein LOC118744146 [Rhagoletis pomonella]|uniref:uncharacterized protein LOC118744146 n=1 Tax=Rhagoletis pomonella TaxID=28610 RepID=UPI00177CC700|nr:uncharacterized protein LOC118744146 [Rhagoletis pomonella]